MSSATILFGLLFGSIGVGYFVYGRKQQRIVPLVCGIGLCIFPYVVHGVLPILGVGAALTAAPYFFRY